MEALKPNETAEQKKKYNKWVERSKKPRQQETVEKFLMRGGKIHHEPAIKYDPIARSKACCNTTFQNLI